MSYGLYVLDKHTYVFSFFKLAVSTFNSLQLDEKLGSKELAIYI